MNAIIIDFDGTIADSFEQVLEFLLSQTGRQLSEISSEERLKLKDLSMKDLARQLGVPFWRLPLVFIRGKKALTGRMYKTPIFAGMEVVLAALHAENYQLFMMSSNSKRNINRFLTQHGMGGYFSRVYGNAGWLGKGPALRRALRQNHLNAATTAYVGDEVRDVIGAQLAGMPSIAVNWGFSSDEQLLKYNPTILVRSPAELQKTLVEWGKTL